MSTVNEPNKSEVAKQEEAILKFWQENGIFEKSVTKDAPNGEFVFYDGPPFATGLPHFGHLLPTSLKDVFPRYQTMKGKRVLRRWGWDCHGLPIENIIEKELGLKNKKDIENLGIDKFNEAARASVLRYAGEWRKIIPRLGRFVDMDDDYKTMDPSYTETIWWIFKTLYDKKLIYEGYKSMHICPRCETTLSNFEVNQGYKDLTDISVTVKFELVDEPGTYLLAWTTTPWTLPGNVALAVNPATRYVKVKQEEAHYILAETLLPKLFPADQVVTVVSDFLGADLIGKKYQPVFKYYADDIDLLNRERGWQVYGADFVTTEDGTGIVHIAPAFGEDDMALGQERELPFVQHVGMDGRFKPEVTDFVGEPVKPKDNHQVADIEVIKYLAKENKLFAKEKIIHSYPHCWRCDTPLLNYAASSWFVKVTDFKDQMVEANSEVGWVPEHVKEGRFGKWLSGARDWAISRSRFWGAPLPVWKCADCNQVLVTGSVQEVLEQQVSTAAELVLVRHAEAANNVTDLINDELTDVQPLTELGQQQAIATAEALKVAGGADVIVASPFARTQATAAIIAATLGLSAEQIITEPRLGELKTGGYNGQPWSDFITNFKNREERFTKRVGDSELIGEIRTRAMAAVFDLAERYPKQKIIIVSHGLPLFLIQETLAGKTSSDLIKKPEWSDRYFGPAEARPVQFKPYPHNRSYELDLHRPYIDEVKLVCACGGEATRVPEVFDCWFESGAMPYGQAHYPFENTDTFNPEAGQGFPADFIAEGLDQTRGWFYSLLALAVGLFGRSPYKNVVVNGLILAEDGQKMSKRLNNYPDINLTIDKFGADALRFYLLSSPAVHADDFAFSEKGLAEVYRRLVLRLGNVLSFYEMYAGRELASVTESSHLLDRWIMARLNATTVEVEAALDRYEVDRAARPIDNFIDDLSNWYIRRSRERFKSVDEADRLAAISTTSLVLHELALLVAPFMPFMAEQIYQKIKSNADPASVHLASWPVAEVQSGDQEVIDQMVKVRELVSAALLERATAGVKVRQPLGRLLIGVKLEPAYEDIIKDEVNVKEVVYADTLSKTVDLDLTLTDELKGEGVVRELSRRIQDERKAKGLQPDDVITLELSSSAAGQTLVKKFETSLARTVGASTISYQTEPVGAVMVIDELEFSFRF